MLVYQRVSKDISNLETFQFQSPKCAESEADIGLEFGA
jgi:hypothetical protein